MCVGLTSAQISNNIAELIHFECQITLMNSWLNNKWATQMGGGVYGGSGKKRNNTNSLCVCLCITTSVRWVCLVACDCAAGRRRRECRRLPSLLHPPLMLRRAPVVPTTKILCVSNMEELAVEVRGSYGAYYKVNWPLVDLPIRKIAHDATHKLKWTVVVHGTVIRRLLDAFCSRL